jgi:hypothetical protein
MEARRALAFHVSEAARLFRKLDPVWTENWNYLN